jgi:hypothetical protein
MEPDLQIVEELLLPLVLPLVHPIVLRLVHLIDPPQEERPTVHPQVHLVDLPHQMFLQEVVVPGVVEVIVEVVVVVE